MYGSKEEIAHYFIQLYFAVSYLLLFAAWKNIELGWRLVYLVISVTAFINAYLIRHNMSGGRPAI